MLRFHSALTGVLASAFVVPLLVGQDHVTALQDALAGTRRALDVLKGLEPTLKTDPDSAVGLILSATESPVGGDIQRDQRLDTLRQEVNLLQMELDSLVSPVLGIDGAVQSQQGAVVPLPHPVPRATAGITTGMDESMRALLTPRSPTQSVLGTQPRLPDVERPQPATNPTGTYSADPLRHGITCYRAGRYDEAFDLLAPIDSAQAMYWQARTLERLGRVGEAIQVMERAIAKGGEGFELRRAETDLEFLRWKRDFLKNLPLSGEASGPIPEMPQ